MSAGAATRSIRPVRPLLAFTGLAILACACSDAPQPAAPAESIIDTVEGATDAVAAVQPEGFGLIAARVTESDGSVCDLCLWLAETGDQRRQGLMFVTDLGPADGMAFRYPSPHSGSFWMKNTILPLSIAFYDPQGDRLDAFDMEPCEVESCPRYSTPDDFVVAVEVEQGDLSVLGLTPGSRLELLDVPCDEV